MSSQKRKILSLEESESCGTFVEGESVRLVAQSLRVGKTQVQAIAKEKDDILRCCKDRKNGDC